MIVLGLHGIGLGSIWMLVVLVLKVLILRKKVLVLVMIYVVSDTSFKSEVFDSDS